jgi:hypothetical protein
VNNCDSGDRFITFKKEETRFAKMKGRICNG